MGNISRKNANVELLDLDLDSAPTENSYGAPSNTFYAQSQYQAYNTAPLATISSIQSTPVVSASLMDQLGQLGLGSSGKDVINLVAENGFVPSKTVLLNAGAARGMEISGTFARRRGRIFFEMTFSNKAMQPLSEFMIQFNKNTYN